MAEPDNTFSFPLSVQSWEKRRPAWQLHRDSAVGPGVNLVAENQLPEFLTTPVMTEVRDLAFDDPYDTLVSTTDFVLEHYFTTSQQDKAKEGFPDEECVRENTKDTPSGLSVVIMREHRTIPGEGKQKQLQDVRHIFIVKAYGTPEQKTTAYMRTAKTSYHPTVLEYASGFPEQSDPREIVQPDQPLPNPDAYWKTIAPTPRTRSRARHNWLNVYINIPSDPSAYQPVSRD